MGNTMVQIEEIAGPLASGRGRFIHDLDTALSYDSTRAVSLYSSPDLDARAQDNFTMHKWLYMMVCAFTAELSHGFAIVSSTTCSTFVNYVVCRNHGFRAAAHRDYRLLLVILRYNGADASTVFSL